MTLKRDEVEERLSKGEASVIRLKEPDVFPEYIDIVSGFMHNKGPNAGMQSTLQGQGIYQDPILMKSDGLPTYHLANVVDDHLMQITHVIRASVCHANFTIERSSLSSIFRNGNYQRSSIWSYTKPLGGSLQNLHMSDF